MLNKNIEYIANIEMIYNGPKRRVYFYAKVILACRRTDVYITRSRKYRWLDLREECEAE